MLRLRRYRVFLVFAVITVFALYKFGSSSTSWRRTVQETTQGLMSDEALKADGAKPMAWQPKPQVAQETSKFTIDILAATTRVLLTPPPIAPVPRPTSKPNPTPVNKPKPEEPAAEKPTPVGVGGPENDAALPTDAKGQLFENGQGRLEVTPLPSSATPIHWQKQSEHFPVPSESIIPLPTGKSKPIPRIQFAFGEESAAAKADRLSKLETIKGVFKKSWDGYKKFAWLQDELSPTSGNYRNPFASWGATLVDALDTLWIMGFEDEFKEAVEAVNKIDFTTTPRPDIPLFETTIRYLGGLLAAYDISGQKHKNLLNKAVELAEVLISAFDTPNRMPETYYYWRPAFASQAHRASNRVVLAEIGSLSVEFTRLAQLTKENKYYDAVARITDQLEEFQNKTRLPGMWPTYLDASGCGRPDWSAKLETPLQPPDTGLSTSPKGSTEDIPLLNMKEDSTPTIETVGGVVYTPLNLPPPIVFTAESPTAKAERAEEPSPTGLVADEPGKGKIQNWGDDTAAGQLNKGSGAPKRAKRQLDDAQEPEPPTPVVGPAFTEVKRSSASASPTKAFPECEEQGFASSSDHGNEDYTLGGLSDSTYEYLQKEYLLLGGQVEKYRTMHEMAMDVVKRELIFRPMLPDEDDILFSGSLSVLAHKTDKGYGILEGENAHLTCFAGGMFGMGAKLFDRPEDLEIAKKLTEGCIWSYDVTSSGIMPESFQVIPCESKTSCPWNQTKYDEALDPNAEMRFTTYKEQIDAYNAQMAAASSVYLEAMAIYTGGVVSGVKTLPEQVFEAEATRAPEVAAMPVTPGVAAMPPPGDFNKRQLDETPTVPQMGGVRNINAHGEFEDEPTPPTPVEAGGTSSIPAPSKPVFPAVYSPPAPLTHTEYIKNKIEEERLPSGVTYVKARNYILRPEAIESVWYMYRITGDPHWREAGWRMFEAINRHTSTKYGNSAINDVTKKHPEQLDEMESFWLAETLKYFYLLFAEENVVSLDEWVLNTEAHPFRRPR